MRFSTGRPFNTLFFVMLYLTNVAPAGAASALLPDGRAIAPAGFTIPVESFASDAVASPDGAWLAVLAEGSGALDILSVKDSLLAARLPLPGATGVAWTPDGLFVARGYAGVVARFAVDSSAPGGPVLTPRQELAIPGGGLVNGVAEDPATHRIAVARTADKEVVTLDEPSGRVLSRHATDGEPFGVAFAGDATFATLYDSDHVVAWHGDATPAVSIATGPHPTAILAAAGRVFVADADGHDVAELDPGSLALAKRYDLGLSLDPPAGQTPAGMALSRDGGRLFVAESGFNDVAVLDLASGRVASRIPTGWYPTAVVYVARALGKKDLRVKEQLWIASAQGLGSQPDPAGEWNGTYTGLVSHLVVEPNRFAEWSAQVARNDGFAAHAVPSRRALPPIRHVVFIVRENKQFDEEFGDEPRAAADPALVVYGRAFTPNAHALAERYTLFDDFMGNGEASIYGHSWTTQGMTNDYHERNAHARDESGAPVDAAVAWSIWPYPVAGEDSVPQSALDFDWFRDLADLANGPRVDVSGVFGPRGELIDELERKHVAFRVYGEQLTMRPGGRIAAGLAEHADRDYPGAHIDFGVLDTERARLFLDDVKAHGLPQYAYLTLPTDHTAGTKPGFYTPASYVANNDVALGTIVAGLSHRADWRDTVVFVTTDDPQGTGDHIDAHRMPAFAIGPYVRRGFIDHTRYSIPSILRTVEVLYGLDPLNIYDAGATPMLDAFTTTPQVAAFEPLPSNVPLERNPGKATSLYEPLDGPDAPLIAAEEWQAMRGRP